MIEGPSSEVETRVIPDVLLENFVVFERPDVRLDNFAVFERPDVGLDELAVFQTIPVRRKGAFREWIESLAFTVIFVLVFTTYIAQATQVPTESMKPTILVGDHFFLDKIAFPANYPVFLRHYLPHRSMVRGDIVAFKSPTDGNIPFVKRVIGMYQAARDFTNGSMVISPLLFISLTRRGGSASAQSFIKSRNRYETSTTQGCNKVSLGGHLRGRT